MDYNDLIDYYVGLKLKGTDYTTIREELKQRNINDDAIKTIINDIDDVIIHEEWDKIRKGKQREYYIFGLFLAALGLFITFATYTGFINLGDSYIIMYGPFFSGIFLMLYAKRYSSNTNKRKTIQFKRKYNKNWDL